MLKKSPLALIAKLVGLSVPLVFGLSIGHYATPYLPIVSSWVTSLGAWAPVAYVVIYIVGVVLMLPVFLLIMAGGAMFGATKATALAMIGALTGGTLAFMLARHVVRSWVERRVRNNHTLSSIDRSIGENGAKLVFLLRLSPAIPFVLSNYALGITRVSLPHYVAGTLGLVPIVGMYAAFGSAAARGVRDPNASPMSPLVLGIGILATAVLGVLLARITQRALRNAESPSPRPEGTDA